MNRKMNRIGFLCSTKALKPKIVIEHLKVNNFLNDKEIYLISDENDGELIYEFCSDNVIIMNNPNFKQDDLQKIKLKKLDILISVGWSHLIPGWVIQQIDIPIINCHGSYLPDYRGSRAYMHYWANNENYFGASIHFVTEKFDAGSILLRNKIRRLSNETKESMHYRSSILSAMQIPQALQLITNGYKGIEIKNEKARYFKKSEYEELVEIGIHNQKLNFSFIKDIYSYRKTESKLIKNHAPKVMIIGAGILQYYLIEKVNKLGYISVVVDGNSEAIGFTIADYHKVIDIRNQEECLKYAKEMNIDAVITGATDYGVITTSFIAQQLCLNGLDLKVAMFIKNKYLVQNKLFINHLISQKSFQITNVLEVPYLLNQIKFPVIVKPCDGSGSRGVNKATNTTELYEYVELALNSSNTNLCYVEPFIYGQEYGVESFVYKGKIINLVVMKKEMTKPPFYAELGHTISLDESLNHKILKKVNQIIEVLGINYGAVNMDLIVRDSEIYMVDIGARMGGEFNWFTYCVFFKRN